jgi:phage gp29-like protein
MPDLPAAPLSEIGHVVEGPGWWSQLEHEPTPELRWPLSIEVYDRMRRQDAQVGSVLRAVTLPVRRTSWRIDPNGARPEVAQLVSDDLGLPLAGAPPAPSARTRDRFSWKEHLRLALLMLPMGHSFFEQVYRVVGGLARLRKLSQRPSRTIQAVNVDSDGGLISIEQWGNPDGRNRPPVIPVNRLVAYVHEMEGGNWLGQSILRTCYKNWLIKDRMLRVGAQTIERNGMGVPLYKGAPGEANLDKGLAMAKAWRSGDAAGAAVPNEADLVLRGVDGNLPDAEPFIRYQDEQIARAVLAHFLNLGTETGSWALGSTFADFFTLSLQALAEQIADVATQHIVEDLVDLNWGEEEPAPRIVFDEIGSRHPATAEAIKALIDCGALTPDAGVEGHVRTAYGLPPLQPGTRPVAQPSSDVPPTTGPAPQPADAGGGTGGAG